MNPLPIHRRTVRKRATVNELYSASPKCGDNRHTYARMDGRRRGGRDRVHGRVAEVKAVVGVEATVEDKEVLGDKEVKAVVGVEATVGDKEVKAVVGVEAMVGDKEVKAVVGVEAMVGDKEVKAVVGVEAMVGDKEVKAVVGVEDRAEVTGVEDRAEVTGVKFIEETSGNGIPLMMMILQSAPPPFDEEAGPTSLTRILKSLPTFSS